MAIGQLPIFGMASISRSECREWVAPCRLTACRYHLGANGGVEPCALNRASSGPMTCDEIAPLLGMTDENVRLIELDALAKVAPEIEEELELFLEPEGVAIVPRVLAHMNKDAEESTVLDELDTALVEPEELPPEAELPTDPPRKSRVRKSNPNQGNLF